MSDTADCLFCKIAAGDIPSEKVYSDQWVTAFKDINPAAPTHILLIPNRHIARLSHIEPEDASLMGRLLVSVPKAAKAAGLTDSGFRIVVNDGEDGGQTVSHLHIHILGGRRLRWPPG